MKRYSLLGLALVIACGDQLEPADQGDRPRPVRPPAPGAPTSEPAPVPAPPPREATVELPAGIKSFTRYGGAVPSTGSPLEAVGAPQAGEVLVVNLRSAAQGMPSPSLIAWANQQGYAIAVDCRKPLPAELERVSCEPGYDENLDAMRRQMVAAPNLYVVLSNATKADLAFLNSLPQLRGISLYSPALSPELTTLLNRTELEVVAVQVIGENAMAVARMLAPMTHAKALRGLALTLPRTAVDVRIGKWLATLPQLQSLYVMAKGINARSLEPLQGHAALRSIILSQMAVDTSAIKTLAALPALTSLYFTCSDNFDVASLAAAHKLETLTLTRCKVRDLTSLAPLTALTTLDFQEGEVSDAGAAALTGLPQLQAVTFAATRSVTGNVVAALAQLPALRELNLSHMAIAAGQLEPLRAHPALRDVTLGYMGLADDGLEVIATLPRLRKLDISQAKVTDAGVARLRSRAAELELLVVSSPALTEGVLDTVTTLTALRNLWIEGAWLTNASVERLLPLQRLTSLGLVGGKLNAESMPTFLKFPALREAYVHENEFTADAEKRLDTALAERP